jgi:hypothetical protein
MEVGTMSWVSYKGLTVPSSATGDAGQYLTADLEYLADRAAGPIAQSPSISGGAITPDGSDGFSVVNVSTLTATLTINNPSGTPIDGGQLTFRISLGTGGGPISWGTAYAFGTDITTALIPTSVGSKFEIKFIYYAGNSTWRAVAIARGF